MSTNQPRLFPNTDVPYFMPNDAPEWERLNDMHDGIKSFLGGKLSYAPILEGAKQILEIGSGSGAWKVSSTGQIIHILNSLHRAIQAAQTYPDATVTAIDVSPLPPRPLPENVKFLQLDVTRNLPFKPETFDIIHARFVFVHLPHWQSVLQRVISLLKPQGWLMIDEGVVAFYDNSPFGIGPRTKEFNEVYLRHMQSQNIDPLIGFALQPILERTAAFSEVNNIKLVCPLNGQDKDPVIGNVGQVFATSIRKAFRDVDANFVAAGLTSELIEGMFEEEVNDPSRSVHLDIYMTWSQKRPS